MARPAFDALWFHVILPQCFRRVTLEDAQGFVADCWAAEQGVEVVGADVRGMEVPTPAAAGVADRFQDDFRFEPGPAPGIRPNRWIDIRTDC